MELLTTSGISHQLEQLIASAKEEIILVSPYLQIAQILQHKIKKADERNVKLVFVYGKKFTDKKRDSSLIESLEFIKSLKNSELYFCKNLHAKAYLNESFGIMGSMNLYQFSQVNNFELGTVFSKKRDREFYHNTCDALQDIIELSEILKEGAPRKTNNISNLDRVIKAKEFYNRVGKELVEFLISENQFDNGHISVTFEGRIAESDYILNNNLGFVTVINEKGIRDKIREKAKLIAKKYDSGNRFYNHLHANRFCIYDPRNAGDDSFRDENDLKVILEIINLLKNSK